MSETTKPDDASMVKVNHWGFTLMEQLAQFLEQSLKSERPMTTTINATFPDMPDTPVLHLWATTDDKSPVARCREVAAERNEAEAQRDELVAACRAVLEEDRAPESNGGILTGLTRERLERALASARD